MSYKNLMIVTVATLLCPNCTWAGPILTGAQVLTSDASGAFQALHSWNTVPGGADNLWIVDGSDMLGPFINGPTDLNASIAIELSPGTRTFSMFGEGGGESDGYWGIRLYFDGNNTQPGISLFAATDTTSLGADPIFSPAEGTSTLSFQNSEYAVTVTAFRWSLRWVEILDRVRYESAVPGGGLDYTGQLTFQITAIPEPTTFALAACAMLGLVGQRKRRA